jgi:5-methyltetrahydropteroyltriglutamate--homocysteine methyltransferase
MLETTTVGSLPKPEYLAETEKLWPAWRLSGEALEQAKKRATVEWLRHQEDAGIDILNIEARKLEAAGIDLIQFDEPAFNVFLEDVKEWGIDALHRAIAGLSCFTAVHICYGYGIEENLRWKETLGSEWRQYEEIFPALNDSHIDQISLECADSRVPLSLMGFLKNKDLMVGVVAVTRDRVESPDQ